MISPRRAVAIDIDGVLLRGRHVIPRAAAALQKLKDHLIPFVFVTNGGGVSEREKSLELSTKLKFDVRAEQVLLAHTPMRSLVPKFQHNRVLILGRDSCLSVARSYGFPNVVNSKQLGQINDFKAIKGVFIFHDPVDWGLDMQVLTDVLYHEFENQVPFYSSNSDIIYMAEHDHPRYTQGAFLLAFKSLFECYSRRTLNVIQYGKPHKIQYDFAETMLRREAATLSLPEPLRFYGIGDNPASDIKGANGAGDHWSSILVRTGVFNSSTVVFQNSPKGENETPHHICDDILDAVDLIVSDE